MTSAQRTALLLIAWLTCASVARAHDPSAWGGAFRSRDFGGSWLSVDAGLYVGGAMALAVHPRDPHHLLYATDTRLLRSRNGGRDWQPEAAEALLGPVTAVAFAADGEGAVASNAAGVFSSHPGPSWRAAQVPGGAVPARQAVAGLQPGHYLLAGAQGLFLSTDHGGRFARVGEADLPDAPVTALMRRGGGVPALFAVAGGRLWQALDHGERWRAIGGGLPPARLEAVTDGGDGATLWAVAADAVHVSRDAGLSWQRHGAALPETNTSARGLAVSADARVLVLATHRGVLRSEDGGNSWLQVEGNLPVHLEAGLVMRDPHDAQTLYTGFALTPYAELYRRAQQGNNLLSRTDPVSLAGGAAFFVLILLAGIWLARTLARGKS